MSFQFLRLFLKRYRLFLIWIPDLLFFVSVFQILRAAKRSGTSVQAWLWLKLVDFFSPLIKRNIWPIVYLARLNGADGFVRWLKGNLISSRELHGETVFYKTSPKDGPSSSLHILYLHGGAFVMDAVPYYGWMLASLTEQLDCNVVMPIYPLAPEYGWNDTSKVIHEAYDELERLYGAKNIVIMGDSAGGQMTLCLARDLIAQGRPSPRCLVLFSPFIDLACEGSGQEDLVKNDPILDIPFLRRGAKMWLRDTPLDDIRVNILADEKPIENLPPTLVFTGTRDVLNSDARRFKERHPQTLLMQYFGMPHIWMVCFWLPEAHQALKEAAYFIRHPIIATSKQGREFILEASRGKSWDTKLQDADPVKYPHRRPGQKLISKSK